MSEHPWKVAHDAHLAYHVETQRYGHTRESVLQAWAVYAAARTAALIADEVAAEVHR